ncbi:MAG: SDR family NAD(P)-dependent oxidoreductase, partial [Bryobacteraceae bacterium]
MDLGLKDRVAIVAASSKGLGKAVALGLAKEGARLALCSRDAAAVAAAAAEIRAATGVEVLAEPADVTVEEQVADFVRRTQDRFGRLDICVTNAGG